MIKNHLQQADLFLFASLSEGISNAVLEAMACGLPIVTTDCGGMREAVTDGQEGFLTPPRDKSAMAQAVKRIWNSPELKSQMGQAARQRIISSFTLDRQAQDFVALCKHVLEREKAYEVAQARNLIKELV